MRPCWLRQLLTFVLLFSFSFASLAMDAPITSAAMLNASGRVQVNGGTVPRSTALLLGDRIQTQSDSVANITATGSSVMVMPNSLLEFQGDAVQLIQGGVVIATSNGMLAKAYGWTVNPATQKSKFEVAENEGSVIVAAQQGSVTISDGKETSTVQEGQHTTKKKKGGGAAAAGTGGSGIPGKTIAIVAGAAGAAAAGIVLANSGSGSKCVSPSGDKKKCCTTQGNTNNCQ